MNGKKTDISFFLRFYSTPEEEIIRVVEKMKDSLSSEIIIGYEIEPIKISINLLPPEGKQVNLYFPNGIAREIFKNDKVCKELYLMASPKGAKLVERKLGDLGFPTRRLP